jgi:hypothetical protein
MPAHLLELSVSTNANKPATRVLAIPELLNLVFTFLEPQFNAANTCVCKSWSDIALSVLWRDVHDLWRLVRLLGPLRKGLDSSYVCHFIMYHLPIFINYTGASPSAPIFRLAAFRPLLPLSPHVALRH